MNYKCRDNTITCFHPGGGHHNRTIREITVGNVYEFKGNKYSEYYEILPDHGTRTISVPNYCFLPTDEPVTENSNREQEEKEREAEALKTAEDAREERRQQQISDNLDSYYDPAGFQKKQAARKRFRSAISEVFVQGISY